MRFNKAELGALVTNLNTKFDKEGTLTITEHQEGFLWRADVNLPCFCKLRGNLLFYLKDIDSKSSIAGVLVLENCRPIIRNEKPEHDGYVFILEFQSSLTQRICAATAAERLDWVKYIQLASNSYLNQQIKYLEYQIHSATAAKLKNMGNRIELGVPHQSQIHEAYLLNADPLPIPATTTTSSLLASSSATAVLHNQPKNYEEDLSELPICESALSCDNLPRDLQARAPSTRIICSVLQPGEDYLWREHARTELVECSQQPQFLCTMRFRRSSGFTADTLLRFTVYDVRERVSSTAVPLGHVEMALRVIQDTTRFRRPLRSPGGENGFITIASWTPDSSRLCMQQTNTAAQPPRSTTQVFEGSNRQRVHRRSQSLPPRLTVRLFVPQQCGLQRVCAYPRLRRYRLQSALGVDISVQETLLECRMCFSIPQQLLSIWIQREKELLQEISGMGELSGEWRWRQMNLLEEHLKLLKDYSQAKQNIQQVMRDGGQCFKRSSIKTNKLLEFLPVNLHLQRMWAQNETQRTGVLDVITVGAFTRHDAKARKCGGLIKLLQESKSCKLEQTIACKVQAANDAVQAIKQLRKQIVELMSQLLNLARCKKTKGMMPLCITMIAKTTTLLNIWEPSIVEEAVCFIEQHRIIEESDNVLMEPISPFRKISQQLTALELQSPELEDFATPEMVPPDLWPRTHKTNPGQSHPLMRSNSWHPRLSPSASLDIQTIDTLQHVVNTHLRSLGHSPTDVQTGVTYHESPSTVAEPLTDSAVFLDTKVMSNSPSANYYRPTEEPEPLDLTQLNIEACVMCLVSKIKFFCGRCDSPATRLRRPATQLRHKGFAAMPLQPTQPPDVVATPTKQQHPLQQPQLNLNLTLPQQEQKPKKSNKFTDGLDLSQTIDWASELRPSMRKLRHSMDLLLKTARLMHSVQRLQQDMRCNSVQSSIMYRRDVCFSQALTALISALMVKLWGTELDANYVRLLRELGPLAYFEGLLSLYGAEADMWSDMCIAIEDLSAVSFTLVRTHPSSMATPTARVVGSRQELEVLLPVPEHAYNNGLLTSCQPAPSFKITPVFFNVGINEKATLAETLGQTREQHRSNWDNYLRLSQYFSRYRKMLQRAPDNPSKHEPTAEESLQTVLKFMESQLRAKLSKNVKILHLAEDACRLMDGLRFTSCKSAKDRTGMAVTLEQCRVLVHEFQLPATQVPYVLSTMRSEGTRMDNVWKNIDKRKYAFNLPQVLSLPAMYRPPVGSYGKAET